MGKNSKSSTCTITVYFSIKDRILEFFPKAEVVAFGSFATQLYLPDGDVDIAVLTKN